MHEKDLERPHIRHCWPVHCWYAEKVTVMKIIFGGQISAEQWSKIISKDREQMKKKMDGDINEEID